MEHGSIEASEELPARALAWWETRTFALVAMVVATIPLLWPAIPPLVDVPGHIGRYHVALEIARSPMLQRHWLFEWRLIGNLGVDLAVMPLAPLFGVELATKLIVLAIPAAFVGGLFWLSREVDGRVSPLLPMAFPLAYSFAFQFGFINFMLATTLTLFALALWVRLARHRRYWLRAVLFVPVSCIIWIAHSFGWGMLGLFGFAAELVLLRQGQVPLRRAAVIAALRCVPMTLPLLLMAANLGAGHDGLGIEYKLFAKLIWITMMLRERWQLYDTAACVTLFVTLALINRRPDLFRFEPVTGAMAVMGAFAFLALPRLFMGGAYVDARMPAIAVALALAAVRPTAAGAVIARRVAPWAAGFFAMRAVTSSVAFLLYADHQDRAAVAIDHLPPGAAVMVVVDEPCRSEWHSNRIEHIDGLAIVRRDAFTNGQWAIAGQQLISPRLAANVPYRADPSQLAYHADCQNDTTTLETAAKRFDRGTYQYLWLMDFAPIARPAPDLRRIWSNGVSQLYAVVPAQGRLSGNASRH